MQPLRSVGLDESILPPVLDREVWEEGAVTVTGAAAMMACSRKTVFVFMKEGRLPWARLGARRKIPRKAVVDLLAGGASD